MGTIKADTLTGLSSSTEVTIVSNKFTGTASGNITLPGEGGTTTTNLQQGLCKSWAHTTQASSYVLDDSFNVSGITDVAAGQTTFTIGNDMANATYSIGGCCTQESVVIASVATGSFLGRSIANDGTITDSADFCMLVQGDLA